MERSCTCKCLGLGVCGKGAAPVFFGRGKVQGLELLPLRYVFLRMGVRRSRFGIASGIPSNSVWHDMMMLIHIELRHRRF